MEDILALQAIMPVRDDHSLLINCSRGWLPLCLFYSLFCWISSSDQDASASMVRRGLPDSILTCTEKERGELFSWEEKEAIGITLSPGERSLQGPLAKVTSPLPWRSWLSESSKLEILRNTIGRGEKVKVQHGQQKTYKQLPH